MAIYWIGGSPCAGKTTISNIIAQEFDWFVYSIDRFVETYLQRADPVQHPCLTAYKKTGLKTFLLQTPEKQRAQIECISHEQFAFFIDDLERLQDEIGKRDILVEGSNILAKQVAQKIKSPQQAIWIVPTEEFQLETYPKRGSWVQDVLRHHYDSEEGILAFERWMERDMLWANYTAQQARDHDIRVIVVDGKTPLIENAEIVMRHFGLLDS